MTACVNKKSKRVAAVVTASLVGAFSIGAPAVALAANANIETLAVNWASGAKVTAATDGKGNVLGGDLSKQAFLAGSGKYLVPTEVANDFATTDVTGATLTYYKSDKSSVIANPDAYLAESTHLGAFYVKVTVDGQASDFYSFKVVAESALEGVQVKGSIVYNGADQSKSISFVDSEGYDLDLKGANVTFTNSKGETQSVVKNAGNYIASFKLGNTSYNVKFAVSPLDLSKASLVLEDKLGAFADDKAVLAALLANGEKMTDAATDLAITEVSAPNGTAVINSGAGAYEFTVSDAKGDDANVIGSAVVKSSALNTNVMLNGKFMYGSKEVDSLTFALVDGESFDASKLALKGSNGTVYKGDDIEVTYYDTVNKKAVDASALANAGSYEVTARIKPVQDFATGKWTGGTKKISVEVQGAEVESNKGLAFYFDGELSGDSKSVTYDGTDQLKRLSVVIKQDGKTYEEGKDYTLEVTKSDKKTVTEAVDHDTYTVTVKPLTFKLDGEKDFTLTVDKAKIATATDGLKDFLYNGSETSYVNDAVAYTGEDVATPAVQYPVLNADGTVKKEDGKVVYAELASDMYNVVSIKNSDGKAVKAAKDAGTYTVKIALTDKASKNYELKDAEFTFMVQKYKPFLDVEPPAWYASPLETAKMNNYVNGVGNTGLFSPNADITRADAVCVLYNMAGGKLNADGEFGFTEDTGYVTGFSDVNGHAYFAKALAWAKAAGVANGSNGQFRPYDKITREEFASLLANFAKVKGDYVAVDADAVLGSATDYTAWAKSNVAWAKANGIMGNNGSAIDGTGNITRAQVAAMAVNYQPEKL